MNIKNNKLFEILLVVFISSISFVLITGGTRGIGQSIKKAFLDNKANVFFTGTKIEDKNKSESGY